MKNGLLEPLVPRSTSTQGGAHRSRAEHIAGHDWGKSVVTTSEIQSVLRVLPVALAARCILFGMLYIRSMEDTLQAPVGEEPLSGQD